VQKKITIAVVVAVLLGAGYYGWTMLRWHVIFRMKADDIMQKKVARFPNSETVLAIPDMMKEAAKAAHVSTDNFSTSIELYPRVEGPVTFWFVNVKISDGVHVPLEEEQRVESQNQLLADSENLESHGVKIKKVN
jgi:hypothetical protein